ncbi:VaFE repeat-containing surface-anchored protein [Corynebacterium bovis]|uniref:VaFE repeat-containing surface-anchored protein n=1 Tax=Corynebacterium bovis TaxID=36808 RepID=UPI000F646266|nr:VaFE repeat-containing surface-anchored protein [Corynebacterium bovis]
MNIEPAFPNIPHGTVFGDGGVISINDKLGYGWCIDLGVPEPSKAPNKYTTPQKLTHVAPLMTAENGKLGPDHKVQPITPVALEGHRKDAAVYIIKELIKQYKSGVRPRSVTDEAFRLNVALQTLLTSSRQRFGTEMSKQLQNDPGFPEFFEKLTGFALRDANNNPYLEYTGNSDHPIPTSGPNEFITVIPPNDYSIEKLWMTGQGGNQRIIPVDQPGLDIPEDKPSETPTTTSETPTTTSEAPTTTSAAPTTTEPAPATTSEVPAQQPKPEPKHPKIATQAKLDGKDQVVAGATVNDTVTYKDLVPGKKYTLSASLVDKSDESKVLGKGTKEFTPSEANGEVVVPITVDQSVTEPVKAAVAFEELTSAEVTAEGEDSPKGGDTPETTSDDNQVADHKDINDEDQTVTSKEQPTTSAAPTTTTEAPTTTSEAPTTTSEAPTTTSEAPTTSAAPTTTSEAPKTPVVDKHPEIATHAKLDGKKAVVAGATVNDTVTYKDLVPGKKYTLSASLVDKSDESKVLGKGTKEFTPSESDGEVVVPITVDQSVSEPVKAAVAFEELSSTEVNAKGEDSPKGGDTPEDVSDDNQVADHKDINDENQTVTSEDQPTESAAPTTTSEAPTTTSEAPATTSEVPTTTSEAPATTTSEVPSESSEAPISTKKLAPTESAKPELPVSEVTPKIQTEAKFADKKEIVAGTVVNDTVTYTNLIPGKQYTLTAELMDKKDGTTVVGHGSVTFTPESTDGSVVVPITVDDSVTEVVPAAVAFETLTSTQVDAEGKDDVKGDKTPETKDDNQVAKHRDITDQKQTVTSDSAAERHPKIATEAKFENKKEIVAGTKINDTVMFEDLVPNTRYTLTAQLMDKKDGTTVLGHGSTSFIPTTSNGSVVVPITVDESVTEPVASAVAFESLTSTDVDAQGKQNPQGGDTPDDVSDDNQIAEHKDINDDNQTVTSGESKPSSEQQVTPAAGKPGVPAGQGRGGQPSISTHAEIKDNGPLVEGAVVVDQVRFTGLQPGKKYTLEANLVCKADGQPTQARSTVEFVPNQADGKVNVPISVTDAGCSEQVAFETLKDASGAVVATHHDITDADQTVTDHDQPGPNGPGDDQVTPDEGVTVLEQGGVPDSGAPLPADAGRQEIRSIPSGAAHLDAGMPLFI